LLGSLFASHLRSSATHALQVSFGAHPSAIAHALATSRTASVLATIGTALRPTVADDGLVGFDSGLNWILLIGAAVAFAGRLLALVLMRERDFV
jgi:hypothetical protein